MADPVASKKGTNGSGQKTYSFEFLTYFYAAILKSNGGKAAIDHRHMSALSGGVLTASAIEHQLRPVKKRAAELNQALEENEGESHFKGDGKTTTPSDGSDASNKKRGAPNKDSTEPLPKYKASKTKHVKKEESESD